jgi:deoxyribonuclease-4
MTEPLLGAHRPTTGGLANAFASAEEIDCAALQIFTSSPRQWKSRPLPDEEPRRCRRWWRTTPT